MHFAILLVAVVLVVIVLGARKGAPWGEDTDTTDPGQGPSISGTVEPGRPDPFDPFERDDR